MNNLKKQLTDTICSVRNGSMDENQFRATVKHQLDLLETYFVSILESHRLECSQCEHERITGESTCYGYTESNNQAITNIIKSLTTPIKSDGEVRENKE